MDTTAIKTKTATTKGQTDNKPFQIFHCLRALVLVKQWFPQLCRGGSGICTAAPFRCTKKGVTVDRATGIMWRLHKVIPEEQDVALLLITRSKRPTERSTPSRRKLCYSNLHKLGEASQSKQRARPGNHSEEGNAHRPVITAD